jgi:two-component system cell cycle response regulator
MGKLLVQNLRDVDIICRYGGDEFVILLPETDKEMAAGAAEKILQAVRAYPFKNIDNPEHQLPVTISVGVSTLERGGTEDELIKSADAALYRAKSLGRNRIAALPSRVEA